jgi:predicted permease
MAQWHRLLNVFHRGRVAEAIDAELRFHIEERVDELMADGLGESDARNLAARQFGNATQYQERTRRMNIPGLIEDLIDDAAYAVRSLRRTPAFTAAAILTLAFGIGATTAIYSLTRSVWLRPLPFTEPGRVVRIWETNRPLGITRFSASVLNYLSWCERASAFQSLVAFQPGSANLNGQGDPERVASLAVTARFFDTLGIRPILGRSFVAGEDQPGRGRVVMLSDRLWRQRYGADPNLVGRSIQVNGESRTVIGIAPLDIGFTADPDIFEPLTLDPAHENRGNHMIEVLARLKPGITATQAEGDLNRLAAQLEREFPDSNRDWRARMVPALDWIVDRDTRTALLVLMATAGLLLALACINVANLLLARASSRVQEFGVRRALGASGLRMVRQLITESTVLASLGGAVGLVVALAGVRALRVLLSQSVPRATAISLDLPVLAVAAGLTLLTGLLFGLAPAWAAMRTDVRANLQDGHRTTAGSGGLRLRQALVAGEFALATVLVAGAGLLLASFVRIQSVHMGFDPRNVLTARISLPETRYTMATAESFYRNLEVELKALPGVQSAGISSNVPFGGGDTQNPVFALDNAPTDGGPTVQASWRIATRGYFEALHIPLLRGRLYRGVEPANEYPIVLGESLARRLWPDGRDPIGRTVRMGPNRPMTVIGVVGDVRQLDLTADPAPTIYPSTSWTLWDPMVVVMHTAGDPAQLASALRHAVMKLDSQQPIFDVQTMDDLIDANSSQRRLNAFLVGAFALLALALGVIGIAGVVAYLVIQRTPEMAVRIALGATPGRVIRAVIAGGLRICAAGLAAGLIGAYLLGRAMAGLLFQVRPGDPAILGAVAAALLAAALLASWLPARRISRIDPATALRKE